MFEPGWLAEPALHGWQQRVQTRGRLFEARSPYQHVEVYETVPFGRALTLDGAVQTTERDEFIYHEMLAHVPLFLHPRPRRVLIIGGGDGGCLRRVLEHPIEEAIQVEIDPLVVEVSRFWLPSVASGAYDDPRAHLIIGDGLAFLEATAKSFDVILVDSTDPVGAAGPLFTERFYRAAAKRLARDGLLVTQSGSPLLMAGELRSAVDRLRSVFTVVRVYLASIPSYPGVLWSFTLASHSARAAHVSQGQLDRRLAERPVAARYYTPSVQTAAFCLPLYLQRFLNEPPPGHLPFPVGSFPQ